MSHNDQMPGSSRQFQLSMQLSEPEVLVIRKLLSFGVTRKRVSKIFNCSCWLITNIDTRKTWSDI